MVSYTQESLPIPKDAAVASRVVLEPRPTRKQTAILLSCLLTPLASLKNRLTYSVTFFFNSKSVGLIKY